jgi:hypothetical protein
VPLSPVAQDLGSWHFVALAIRVQLLHPMKPRATISQQWVDSFPGDICPSPVTRSRLSLGACCYATCQPCGPHLMDVPRVHMSPRCSALHNFYSRKETLSSFEPPIGDNQESYDPLVLSWPISNDHYHVAISQIVSSCSPTLDHPKSRVSEMFLLYRCKG